MWNTKKIKELAKKDFEKTWLETKNFLEIRGRKFKWKKEKGEPHLIEELRQKIRQIILSYGFKEVINPVIIDEEEIYKQYGPEAPVILDRCFYLAGLPRPEIGLSKEKVSKIKKIIPNLSEKDIENLRKILRDYKKGKLEGDDFVEELVLKLNIKPEQATQILDKIFPELKKLKPKVSNQTLRSHMTGAWFLTLSSLQNKESLPLKLFSIGPKFRREQKLDATHLYNSLVASIVIMAEEFTLEDGEELTRKILNDLGFKKVKFVVKKATSKYYAPLTEEEVFIKQNGNWIEVANLGFYSPISLSNYKIKYPVFNVGFGIERLGMIIYGIKDIRKLVYSQFYLKLKFSDKEILESLEFIEKPETKEGESLAKKIYQIAKKYKDKKSPCEFLIWEGNFLGRKIQVKIFEKESNKKLIGPAGFNKIIVKDGNIIGQLKGKSKLDYMLGFANLAAARIEKGVKSRKKEINVRIGMVKSLSDINFKIPEKIRKFIESENKKIDIRGPMFVEIKAKMI